jgi:hypothetical protein
MVRTLREQRNSPLSDLSIGRVQNFQRPVLVICERSCDLTSTLRHARTYQASIINMHCLHSSTTVADRLAMALRIVVSYFSSLHCSPIEVWLPDCCWCFDFHDLLDMKLNLLHVQVRESLFLKGLMTI